MCHENLRRREVFHRVRSSSSEFAPLISRHFCLICVLVLGWPKRWRNLGHWLTDIDYFLRHGVSQAFASFIHITLPIIVIKFLPKTFLEPEKDYFRPGLFFGSCYVGAGAPSSAVSFLHSSLSSWPSRFHRQVRTHVIVQNPTIFKKKWYDNQFYFFKSSLTSSRGSSFF